MVPFSASRGPIQRTTTVLEVCMYSTGKLRLRRVAATCSGHVPYSCSSTFQGRDRTGQLQHSTEVRTGSRVSCLSPSLSRTGVIDQRIVSSTRDARPNFLHSPFVALEACCVSRCRSDQLNSRLQQRPAPASVRPPSPSDPIRCRPNTTTGGQRRSNQLTRQGKRRDERRRGKRKKTGE